MSSNKIHGGLPLVWLDSASPAFANGQGSASPSYTTDFIAATGGTGNELRLPVFNRGTEDRVYVTTQLNHDVFIPSSGDLLFKPHVHWTFVTEPSDSRTVIWELNYVIAKPGDTFSSTVSQCTATGANIYTTTAAAEVRTHIITVLPDITVAVANCSPSMILVGALKLKSTSTIDDSLVGLLSFDIHYQAGPIGTDTEYS